MSFCAYFVIILCLAVSTDTRSIKETESETVSGERNLLQGTLIHEAIAGNSSTATVNAECKCTNGFCEKVQGKYICKCPPEWGHYTSNSCKQCDCGRDSNCTYSGFWTINKTCVCKEGYEDIDGICKACDCGPGMSCTFEDSIFSKKQCICPKGWVERNGKCADLCLPNPCKNSGRCMVTYGKVSCTCTGNYGGETCQKIVDNCSPNRCQNGGSCFDQNEHVSCACRDQYFGANCEKDMCDPNPCFNGGTCFVKNGSVACFCENSYKGRFCERDTSFLFTTTTAGTVEATFTVNSTRITEDRTRDVFTSISTESSPVSEIKNDSITTVKPDDTTVSRMQFSTPNSTTEESSKGRPLNITSEMRSTTQTTIHTESTGTDLCAMNPCRNGGICRMEGNAARCYCIEPFSGHICEKDPCSSNPCENGGMCKISGTAFRCECSSPYSGKFCEKDPCSENPCQNGGTCFFAGNSFKCLCKQPFAGFMCETDPCVWSPCKNGGVCKIENEGIKCFCKKPFMGEFCDSSLEIDVYIMIFAAASVFLISVLIFVSCILRQRYHALKTS